MFTQIVCAALLAADAPQAPKDDQPQQAYQAARAAAGRSPDDQVKLAYWCEAHGLTAQRMRHLAQAVLADPNHAAARGLLGLVARQDHWMRPDAVADQVRADAQLAVVLKEYDAKRSTTPYTADGQWSLATWAEERGLKEQAKAHYTAVVRLDPKREQAWKKLGYKKHDGHWTTDAEIATARANAEARQAADHKWKPLLEKWKVQLTRPTHRAEAEANLLTVTDPRAVRSIVATFLSGPGTNPGVALRTLAQIDSAAASKAITVLALTANDPNVRRAAVETLRRRDAREFAGPLINLLRERVEYQVQDVAGPGSTGKLLVKEPKRKVQRLYSTPAVPNYLAWLTQQADGAPTLTYQYAGPSVTREQQVLDQRMSYNEFLTYHPTDPQVAAVVHKAQGDAPAILRNFVQNPSHPHNHRAYDQNPIAYKNNTFGFDIQSFQATTTQFTTQTTIPLAAMVAEYQKTAFVARQQIARDVAQLDQYNQQVDDSNDRVTRVLRAVGGEDHGTDSVAWTGWLVNLNGYAMTTSSQPDVPTYTVDVPLAYQPRAVPTTTTSHISSVASSVDLTVAPTSKIASCFGAGTLVRTLTGPRAIETLQVGDLVLTQSISTGSLSYHPILIVHHNPPSPTFLIKLGCDRIVSSPFHRFWKVGQGWVMAHEIHEGDRLRLLSGTAVVERFQAGEVQLVYNLDIAENADFFAGSSAALVHDNTLPDPRLVPFDLAETKNVATR